MEGIGGLLLVLLLGWSVVVLTCAQESLQLHWKFVNDTEAQCNDFTRARYYIRTS